MAADFTGRVSTGAATDRIRGLDGLRAVSIILVLLAHLSGTRHFFIPSTILGFPWPEHLGVLGVRVFFVISGFLITSYLIPERQENGFICLSRFYLRRTLRIFPAYYVYVSIIFLLAASGTVSLREGDTFHAVTYTMNYHHDRAWLLGHAWSLAVEEQFYLLWPVLFSWMRPELSKKILAGYICAAPCWRMLAAVLFPSRIDGIGETFFTTADSIACGCLLAICLETFPGSRLYRFCSESRARWLLVPAILVLSVLGMSAKFRWLLGGSLQNLLITLFIARLIRNDITIWPKVMNWRPFIILGWWSYSVYLWQQPFLNRTVQNCWATAFPVNIILCLVIAAGSYYLIERPFLRLRQQLERRVFRWPQPRANNPVLKSQLLQSDK